MQVIQSYLYDNKVAVQFLDPTITSVRNRVVYSRPIKVYKGIDNPLRIVILNQDQKPYDTTGYNVVMGIQNSEAQTTVASFTVEMNEDDATVGTVTIDRDTMDILTKRHYKLTFKATNTDTNVDRPMYIDDNWGVPLDLEVLPAYWSTTSTPSESDGGDGSVDLGTL